MFWFLWFDFVLISPIVERQEGRMKGNQKNICEFYEIYIWFSLLKIPERNYDELSRLSRMEWGAFGARDVKPEFAWAVSRAKTAERVFEPCEKTQSAEKSFYVKVISFSYFFPFCFCAHHHSPSRHSFMPLPFIYNPLCALMARKKGQVFGDILGERATTTTKGKVFLCDEEMVFHHRPRSNHWMKHIRHDCCVFFVLWIHEQYIKLGSLRAKCSICPEHTFFF